MGEAGVVECLGFRDKRGRAAAQAEDEDAAIEQTAGNIVRGLHSDSIARRADREARLVLRSEVAPERGGVEASEHRRLAGQRVEQHEREALGVPA